MSRTTTWTRKPSMKTAAMMTTGSSRKTGTCLKEPAASAWLRAKRGRIGCEDGGREMDGGGFILNAPTAGL